MVDFSGLVKSGVYYIAEIGNVIYAGLKKDTMVFRPVTCPTFKIFIPLADIAKVKMPLDKHEKLQATMLNEEELLQVGDYLFFENKSGIFCGIVIMPKFHVCTLACEGMTADVNLWELFSYESVFGKMQTRRAIIKSMSCEGLIDTKLGISAKIAC